MKKRIILILLLVVIVFSGCSKSQTIADTSTKQNFIHLLEQAEEIKVKEKWLSFEKSYDIYIDDVLVGNVSGEFIHITGDVFTLTDIDGKVISTEKQIKRWGIKLNRLAEVRDEKENVVGYIGEDVISDFFTTFSKYKFHFYDANKNELAHSDEKLLKFLYEYCIYGNDDIPYYRIQENWSLVDEYTITKLNENSLPMDQVIFQTCIVDAIRDAEKEEN